MPPGTFFEILIATGAFWINLDHQLRAEIFSNIVYSSPATYFILVIVNVRDFFCIDADTRRSPIGKKKLYLGNGCSNRKNNYLFDPRGLKNY